MTDETEHLGEGACVEISPIVQRDTTTPFQFPKPAEGEAFALPHDEIRCTKAYERGYELQGEIEKLNGEVRTLRKSLADKSFSEDEVKQAQRIIKAAKSVEDAEHKRWLKQYHDAGKYKALSWIVGSIAVLGIAALGAALAWEKHKHEAAPAVSHEGGS